MIKKENHEDVLVMEQMKNSINIPGMRLFEAFQM